MLLNIGIIWNDVLTAVISFSETRRNHKGPNQVSKDKRGHTHVLSSQKSPLLLLNGEHPKHKLCGNMVHVPVLP